MTRYLLLFTITSFFVSMSAMSQIQDSLRPSTDPSFERASFILPHLGDRAAGVIINGRADESFWDLIPVNEMRYDITYAWWSEGAASINPIFQESGDYHITWRAAMDNEFFYILCDITDDQLVTMDMFYGAGWLYDNIELYFLFEDESVVMPDWELNYASWLRIYANYGRDKGDTIYGRGWVEPSLLENRYRPHGMRTRTRSTSSGYMIEAKIPFSLIIPSVDGVFGYYIDEDEWVTIPPPWEMENFQFDIVAFDRDTLDLDNEDEPYMKKLAWSTNWNRNFLFTEGYGIAEVCRDCIVLNADKITDHANPMQVYPNPASEQITIRNLSASNDVFIIDMLGQMVRHFHVAGPESSLDISSLKNGLYIIRATNLYGEVSTGKLIKR